MVRLLQVCKRAVISSLLAGALFGGPISSTVYCLPLSGQPSRIAASEQIGDSVGITYIDLQTRQSMPERLVYNPDKKDVQMVWMADTEWETSKSLRGSYLGVIDVSGEEPKVVELPIGWQRIETVKSGWPSISAFADGSVGVAAHAPLLFSKNSAAAYTAFNTGSHSFVGTVYFRSAIDGSDVVHLIFAYSSGSEAGHLGYVRSDNKGQTWSTPILLTGASAPGGSVPGIAGFDSYAITARGSKIVIVYADNQQRLWKRESLNSGEAWQNPVVLHEPQYNLHVVEHLQGDTVSFTSDPTETAGTQMDVILDQQGMAHVVFSLMATTVRGKGLDNGGTVTRIGSDTIDVNRDFFRTWGLGYIKEGVAKVERMGPPAGGQWDGTGVFIANSANGSGAGYSCYPQLGIDANGVVYCIYTSVQNGDLKQITADQGSGPTTVDALFGHIYATHKPAGHNWSTPLNLTPTGVDCLYGTLANTVDNKLYIGYQSDATPGIRVVHLTSLEATVVRFRALPTAQLNEATPVSVQPPTAGFDSDLSLEIFPNPITDQSHVVVGLSAAADVSVELYTMTGAKVATLFRGMLGTGQYAIPLGQEEVHQLASGQYYCIVRTPGAAKSGIISILR